MTEFLVRNLVLRFHDYNQEYKAIYVDIKRWVKSSNSKGNQVDAEVIYKLLGNFRGLCLDFIQLWDLKKQRKFQSCASLNSECSISLKNSKNAETNNSDREGLASNKITKSTYENQIEVKLSQTSISGNATDRISRFNKFVKYVSPTNNSQVINSSNSLNLKSKTLLEVGQNHIMEDLVPQEVYLKPTRIRKNQDASLLKSITQLSDVSDSKISKDIFNQTLLHTVQSSKENHILKTIIDNDISRIRSCLTPTGASMRSNRLQTEASRFLTKTVVTGSKGSDIQSVHLMSVSKEQTSPNIRKLMASLNKRLNTYKANEISQDSISN